ncbi:MAG TPA: tRNA lysidine(34) synthetase TilS, partial [Burkholderiales bacterium]|nr:tRNA lysidine(34) synthetase TilS [Burkholderiales bacterium]
MASTKRPRSADPLAETGLFLEGFSLQHKSLAVALSGGMDSVVLLHLLRRLQPRHRYRLRALHVHHGLSPNADAWAAFCRRYCRRLGVPLSVRRVAVTSGRKGPEAAAREARYAAFGKLACDAVVLAHHLDDQAETVLMNLLRGAGARGASGMPEHSHLGTRLLLRPLLGVSRERLAVYAREQALDWVEDESNADEALTRNFIRRRIGPLLATRFPRWKESLARAARHFAQTELDAKALLREFLSSQGMRAPSEAKLVEMLKQLTSQGARTLVEHEGLRLRVYRGQLSLEAGAGAEPGRAPFAPFPWNGATRVPIPALGGEIRFRRAKGEGIDLSRLAGRPLTIGLRRGGERLQPDALRPRRTLKNLFQEAGIAPW